MASPAPGGKNDFVLSAPTKRVDREFEYKVPPTPPIVPPQVKSSEKEHTRQIVICEIINTERDYIRDLKLIQAYFKNPMTVEQRSSIGISNEELILIFSNLDAILEVNSKFLNSLEAVYKNAKGGLVVEISKPFIDHVKTFSIYGEYLCNQPEQMKTINRLKQENSEFETFLAEKMLEPELKGLCLFSFLVKPVQRICKYPLLLRELNKNTEPGHKDLKSLQEAIVVIEAAVTSINEQKRVTDEMSRIMELTQVIEGFDKLGIDEVKDRRLLKEHTCSVVTENGEEEGNMYLFNDLLVTALKLKKKRKGFNGFVHAVVTLTRAYYKDMRVQQDEAKQIKIEDPMTNSQVVMEILTPEDDEVVKLIRGIVDETKASRRRDSSLEYASHRQSITLGLTDDQRAQLRNMGYSTGSNTPHRRPPPPPPGTQPHSASSSTANTAKTSPAPSNRQSVALNQTSSAPPPASKTSSAPPPATKTSSAPPPATKTAQTTVSSSSPRAAPSHPSPEPEERKISCVPLAQPTTPVSRRPPPAVPAVSSVVVVASAKSVQRVSVRDMKPVK